MGDGAVGEEGGQADAVVGEVRFFAEDEDGVGDARGEGAEGVFKEFFAGWGGVCVSILVVMAGGVGGEGGNDGGMMIRT